MAHDPMIGQRLERYEILALLGEGGMGAVYRGRDTVLKRDVALKFMHAQYARKAEFQQRFLNEAQATAQLDHPGIVKVYDYRQDGDYLYIVMEYIAGGNLSQMLQDLRAKQQWLGLREAVQLVRQVSLALDYAHRKGVLHRDIKPANIMIKPEPAGELSYQPVITDLGLARLGEGLGLTQTGASMGTPSYMSPEQALGKPMDARSDVYSLGILLYELAVGQRPFNIKSLSEAMRIHPVEEPPRPSSLRPGLPAALEQVILRALKKEPAARYQSAASLAGDLGKLEPTIAAVAPPPTAAAGTVPLMTQYQESVLELRGQSLVEELPAVSAVADSLQLRRPDGKLRTLPLATKVVTVGRASDNTVQLDDAKVSQHHLRIEYDGSRYRVTDLKSTNGTYMGAVKLLSGVPEVWEPQKPLRVGAHHLLLVLASGKSSSSATEYESVGSYLGAAGLLQVVKPGEQVSVPLVLHNATRQVDYLAPVVEGVPPAWVGPLKPANLHPEQQQDATVTLRPPAASDSRAGDYAVQIYAASRNTGQKTLVQALTLRVLPVAQVSSALEPETVRAGRAASVVLQNTGNAPQRFQVTWRDPEQALQFHPTQAQLVVEPGQRGIVKYTARPRRRRWFGSSLAHPLTVTVVTEGGTQAEHHGTLQSSSLFPVWVPLLLLLLLAALGTFIFNQLGNREKEQQVAQATTAALALAADDDGDGLPNVEEIRLGTDPAKADSDGDGLNDKKEVDLGTDPKNPDTDK